MIQPVIIQNILSNEEVNELRLALAKVPWEDGTKTAGPYAALEKHNQQANSDAADAARQYVVSRIRANDLFNAIVRPTDIAVMFSRYSKGDRYGVHVDAPMMENSLRRDVSFTLWLTSPASYGGGELLIETPFSEYRYKHVEGSMVVYPSTSLHQVTEVTSGERLVVVGWARSFVRDPAKRELLFELDAVRASLFDRDGNSNEVQLLGRCSANLMRMWMDDR